MTLDTLMTEARLSSLPSDLCAQTVGGLMRHLGNRRYRQKPIDDVYTYIYVYIDVYTYIYIYISISCIYYEYSYESSELII